MRDGVQVGEARTEIVKAQADIGLTERIDGAAEAGRVFGGDGLGDFKLEQAVRQGVFIQNGDKALGAVLLHQVEGGEVDLHAVDLPRDVLVALEEATDAAELQIRERVDQAVLFGQTDEHVRRDPAQFGMAQAAERFEGDEALFADGIDRLIVYLEQVFLDGAAKELLDLPVVQKAAQRVGVGLHDAGGAVGRGQAVEVFDIGHHVVAGAHAFGVGNAAEDGVGYAGRVRAAILEQGANAGEVFVVFL